MPEPTVITGSINTNSYAEREMEFPQQRIVEGDLIRLSSPEPGTYRKKVRNFRSLLPSLRISVIETHDRAAMDGTPIPGEHEVVKFTGGKYRTSDKKKIKAIETSSEWGINVYDADIYAKQSQEARAASMAKQMTEDPELMAQVMNALKVKEGAENFEPPEEKEKPTEE